MRFENKVVLVMGGNSGIGRASAEAFAREGAQLIITGRNVATLHETAAAIGGSTQAVCADIADVSATQRLMLQIKEQRGHLDVLFVNAGIGAFRLAEEVTEEFYDEMMAVNLRGPYFAVKHALPLLQAGSAIVLTSSIGHCKGIEGNSVYAASKAGLRALVRNFGAELVSRGVRVNCFSPGPIDTPLIHRSGLSEQQVEGLKTVIRDKVPMKRFGTPEEAARAVLYLASEDSSFVTGIDLIVDGGVVNF